MGLDNIFNVLAGRACKLETWGLQKYFRPCPLVLCGLQFTGLTSASCLVIFLVYCAWWYVVAGSSLYAVSQGPHTLFPLRMTLTHLFEVQFRHPLL